MTDLVGELRSRRLLRELDPIRRPGAGRPTRPIALDGEPWCVLGVHLDIDRLEMSVATVGGRELWQETLAIDRSPSGLQVDLSSLQPMLAAQLARLPEHHQVVAIEVGLPGFVTGDGGTVSWSADLGWRDLPLRALIGQSLAQRGRPDVHVGISNDAQLAALYAARVELGLTSHGVVAYFGGRRNVGSAIIIDGEIFPGAQGGAGDFAHQNIDPNGPPEKCGRHGCLESLIGPRQLLVSAELVSGEDADQLVTTNPAQAVHLIVEAAAGARPRALAALSEAGVALGRAIDNVIGTVNPDAVILGGYLGALGPYLIPYIEPVLVERLSVDAYAGTRIVAIEAAERDVVMGATLAARDACLYDPLARTRPLAG